MSFLPVGKLRATMLQALFDQHPVKDPRVVVGPRVGEDAAVIDIGDRYLIATADPITFATTDIAWYALQVNANDIAVRGARPRWFLATVLFPDIVLYLPKLLLPESVGCFKNPSGPGYICPP